MFLPLTTGDKLRRPPILIGVIIALCVVVFLLPHAHPKASTDLLGHAVREDTGQAFVSFDHPLHLFTYTFLHGSLSHLLGNMFFLWTFGRLLEARWGRLLTALCFVVAGAAGAALHAVATTRHGVPLIGASGAISGLAGAVVVALPNARFNRIFSPLLWPVTPIVALARGRGFAALLELLPFYGWILKLPRGLPATFVLPAWLSLDMFSMMA
jgi:membrane associated rhomboid family serine protease